MFIDTQKKERTVRLNPVAEQKPRRDAFCRECGKEYGLTTRTFCSKCDSYSVEAWGDEVKREIHSICQ